MKKGQRFLVCLLLVVSLLLGGCQLPDVEGYLDRLEAVLGPAGEPKYSEMEYTRPDVAALERIMEESCEICRSSADISQVLDAIYAYYDCYDDFYTNMSLAYVRYNTDLRDTYWEGEYDFCARNAGTADAGLEELYYALAQSPIRDTLDKERYFGPDFLTAYEGESHWDSNLLALMEEEARLEGEYYLLMGAMPEGDDAAFLDAHYDDLAQLLVELVQVRQKIAQQMGWQYYPGFAYEFYHYRDYVPAQAKSLTEQIQQELVPLYRRVVSADADEALSCSRKEMTDYVARCAKAMGGYVEEAWETLEKRELWELEPGEYKLDASFEVYLTNYQVPLIFVNPTQTQYDKLVLAHEFGHFAHDYVIGGTGAGTDVAEVLSQGMEYLSLCLCEDTEELTRLKMTDSLGIYVEQAAYASFEQQLYEMEEEELTAENIHALYTQVGKEFGFDCMEWDTRDYVLVTHFFTEPMYIISYVVSNDAAFQLYELERSEPGAGVAKYRGMPFSEKTQFCGFVEDMGMERIFTKTRIEKVRQTMEAILIP